MKAGEYKIECEYCDTVTAIIVEYSDDTPMFCPMCGRRSDPVDIAEEDTEYEDYDD